MASISTMLQKKLLAENILTVGSLVLFTTFDMNVSADLGAYIAKLSKFWSHPDRQCHRDYRSNFQKNDFTFDIDWLLYEVPNDVRLA